VVPLLDRAAISRVVVIRVLINIVSCPVSTERVSAGSILY